jgi:transposase-like protein
VDWKKIKAEYIAGGTSYRKLAEKYGVSFSTLRKVAAKENWTDLRNKCGTKSDTKIIEKLSDKSADKMSRVLDITDKLLDKLEQAIEELDIQLYKSVVKTKEIEYNHDLRPDKPTKEIIHEEEKVIEVKSIVDRSGLKAIASSLRDIKEIQMLKTELDKQEQEARIAKLQKDAQEEAQDKSITIVFGSETEDYSE